MPTTEYALIMQITESITPLYALANEHGAADVTQLLDWLVKVSPPLSAFADFRNTNAASLAAAL